VKAIVMEPHEPAVVMVTATLLLSLPAPFSAIGGAGLNAWPTTEQATVVVVVLDDVVVVVVVVLEVVVVAAGADVTGGRVTAEFSREAVTEKL
jgi:hypothetical protein